MTIAERDKIDEVIKAMPREWQERVLYNIDPDLIIEAAEKKLNKYATIVKAMREIVIKYQNRSWDLMTLWEESEEYETALKEARYRN